jgi:tRNA nucleotidyltransferase (CCA-adding enzyme)
MRIDELVNRAIALEFETRAPRPILQGRHLISLGFQPGPKFKPVLDHAFEAQLDGAFTDEVGALDWLRSRLQATAGDLR